MKNAPDRMYESKIFRIAIGAGILHYTFPATYYVKSIGSITLC